MSTNALAISLIDAPAAAAEPWLAWFYFTGGSQGHWSCG